MCRPAAPAAPPFVNPYKRTMKKIVYLSLLALIALAACNKKEVYPLHFDVASAKTSYAVGDTVSFLFSGNPDMITFYSGETGSRYANRKDVDSTGNALTDVGTPLKDMTTRMDSYDYVYTEAGSYTVTFVAANTTVYGSKTIVKQLDITITP